MTRRLLIGLIIVLLIILLMGRYDNYEPADDLDFDSLRTDWGTPNSQGISLPPTVVNELYQGFANCPYAPPKWIRSYG